MHDRVNLWNEEAQAAFCNLKQASTHVSILPQSDPKLPFVVKVDASDISVMAMLSQRSGTPPTTFTNQQYVPAIVHLQLIQ